MNWVDPRERTLDDLWEAADKACQWRSIGLSFTGLQANITGRGGWNAVTWGWDNIPGSGDMVSAPMGTVGAWGRTPRLALGDLIVRLESTPRKKKPLWFEHD